MHIDEDANNQAVNYADKLLSDIGSLEHSQVEDYGENLYMEMNSESFGFSADDCASKLV